MPKRSKKNSGSKGILVVMIMALMGAGVFAAYVKFAPGASHVAATLNESRPDVTIDTKPLTRSNPDLGTTKTDTYLVPAVVDNEVKLTQPAGEIPDGVKPEVFVVNQTLTSLMIDKARVLDISTVKGLALIHCTPDIQKGYGTMEEGNLIKALQMALGQFKDIKNFQIVVEGQKIESLGNIDLLTPVEVIRPGEQPAPKTSEESTPPNPS